MKTMVLEAMRILSYFRLDTLHNTFLRRGVTNFLNRTERKRNRPLTRLGSLSKFTQLHVVTSQFVMTSVDAKHHGASLSERWN